MKRKRENLIKVRGQRKKEIQREIEKAECV